MGRMPYQSDVVHTHTWNRGGKKLVFDVPLPFEIKFKV